MFWLLSKIFIKNTKDYQDATTRGGYGVLSGILGICLNILLFGFKLFAGIICGAVSITADAFNNLTDAGSSIISLIGVKKANKHADEDHPFGHGRVEYIAGLLVAVLIIFVAYELLTSSVKKIITPSPIKWDIVVIVILSVSVAIKLYMFLYNYVTSKKINSLVLKATAFDSISDCISTAVVLIGIILAPFIPFEIDGYIGVLVAIFILITGLKSLKETANELVGSKPDKEFVENIKTFVLNFDERVLGLHDLIIHNYGINNTLISLHCEVDSEGDINRLHEMIDLLENALHKEFNCLTTIHMDPIVTNCEKTNQTKQQVEEKIKEINPLFSIHDFRMTDGEDHINLIFDVAVPTDIKENFTDLEKTILEKVKEINSKFLIVIKIEHSFV